MPFIKKTYQSPLGALTLLANDTHLVGVWFNDQNYFGSKYRLDEIHVGNSQVLQMTQQWLDDYFSGKQPAIDPLPLDPAGTSFRRQVFQILTEIPYGSTITYQAIVDKLTARNGNPTGSARAVGGAVGHNPISILIPCHRVIGTNGQLTGYAGGIDRKLALLKLEGAR